MNGIIVCDYNIELIYLSLFVGGAFAFRSRETARLPTEADTGEQRNNTTTECAQQFQNSPSN
eukprot:scaffold43600_cov36-Cyclotella_meneghiniana.AAC.2